jgi:formimidoylglutamate deiminase
MTVIWAEKALLESGWAENVRVESLTGTIGSVQPGQPGRADRIGSCCPRPPIATATRFSAPWQG